MAKYRLDSIADLARQLVFSPTDARSAQVTAAEVLLHTIEPTRAYPLDFVIFRITGFQRKQATDQPLTGEFLTGMALQHDIGLLIEQLSDTLNVATASLREPVLTIDDVCQKFNVTSKTIQRWRRRGLAARRFIFADGKRRVGFLLASVERFFAMHHERSLGETNLSQVSDPEHADILRRAQRLALQGCWASEISRRIGRRLGRSPLTVQHTIRKHDEEQPASAIFPLAGAPPTEEQRAIVFRGHKRQVSLKAIARRLNWRRAAVARVLLEERAAVLNRKKVRFIDDPLYHDHHAPQAIAAMMGSGELASAGGSRKEELRIPRDLTPYLQALYRTPLLTPAAERSLFLKFNFEKYQFVTARRRLEVQFARNADLLLLEQLLKRVVETKNRIISANLRLVVSIARRHLRPGIENLSLMELISEGNLTLMRAVEGFDVHKGHRFSTYATLSLMKAFARSVPLMRSGGRKLRHGVRLLGDAPLALLADQRQPLLTERIMQRDQVRQLLERLDENERRVLAAHYGLSDGSRDRVDVSGLDLPAPPRNSTYRELGRRLGMSKQRVQQIEQGALAKLRTLVPTAASLERPR